MPTDEPDDRRGLDGEPEYRVYGAGRESPRPARRPSQQRSSPPASNEAEPPYRLYRSRPRSLRERLRGEDAGLDELLGDGREGGGGSGRAPRRGRRFGFRRGPITWRRVLLWVVAAIVGWLVLSLALFLISAQVEQSKVDPATKAALKPAGYPLWSANTILILGSDARPKGSREPGADPSGPSRSDTILLWRVGAGHSARLSIPRDTVVPIPGHGTDKINAAYAYGGAALSIRTIEQFTGIPINHLIEVSFENFPKLINALGGVNIKLDSKVCSEISGGVKNGGQTLRLSKGEHHLSGEQALVIARTRENLCNPAEDDLTREARQQQILSGMKSQLTSPLSFFRLPWISWYAPKAMQTDMSGPTLMGFFAAAATSGSPPVRVLKPTGSTITAAGGDGLTVSPGDVHRAAQQFLNG